MLADREADSTVEDGGRVPYEVGIPTTNTTRPRPCALCLRNRELRDSHLIPKAAYRLIKKTSGESPVVITKGLVSTTDLQVHRYLLCDECEQRFAGPERYALFQCNRGRRFRLQELLGTLTPLVENADPVPYDTSGVPGLLDIPSLVYFSSSLLWRASVSTWRFWGQMITLDLGRKYNEEFRRYLLGESGFPADAAVWISVTSSREPPFVCVGPHLRSKTTYHQFEMQIFGIRWSMFVGREIHPTVRRMCSLRAPEGFIYSSNSPDSLAVQGVGNLMTTARIAQNVEITQPPKER